jgi:hypothetical protein
MLAVSLTMALTPLTEELGARIASSLEKDKIERRRGGRPRRGGLRQEGAPHEGAVVHERGVQRQLGQGYGGGMRRRVHCWPDVVVIHVQFQRYFEGGERWRRLQVRRA